jgi:hypothetical protein
MSHKITDLTPCKCSECGHDMYPQLETIDEDPREGRSIFYCDFCDYYSLRRYIDLWDLKYQKRFIERVSIRISARDIIFVTAYYYTEKEHSAFNVVRYYRSTPQRIWRILQADKNLMLRSY